VGVGPRSSTDRMVPTINRGDNPRINKFNIG